MLMPKGRELLDVLTKEDVAAIEAALPDASNEELAAQVKLIKTSLETT